MADKKIKATAQLFLDVSDAQSDAKKFVENLKKQLSSIEAAADKMTVFKDMVGYIGQVDKALAALQAKNGDAFKHMFDGMDVALRKQLEDLFGISSGDLSAFSVLQEKLQTLTPKSGIAELRKFAKEVNAIYSSMGINAPLDIESDFTKVKASQKQIDLLTEAVSNFAIVWKDVNTKIKDGFGFGNQSFESIGGNLEKDLKESTKQIEASFDSLIKLVKQKVKEVYDAQIAGSSAKQLDRIKKPLYKALSLTPDDSEFYLIEDVFDDLEDNGDEDKAIKAITSLIENKKKMEKEIKNTLSSTPDSTQQKTHTESIANSIKQEAKETVNAIEASQKLITDELKRKVQEYYKLQKELDTNDNLSDDEQDLIYDKQAALDKYFISLDKAGNKKKEIMGVLGDIQSGDMTDNDALQELCNIFQIQLPTSIETSKSSVENLADEVKKLKEELAQFVNKSPNVDSQVLNGDTTIDGVDNNIKEDVDKQVKAMEYGKRQLVDAIKKYYHAVSQARKDGFDPEDGWTSSAMENAEEGLAYLFDKFQFSEGPKNHFKDVLDSIVHQEIDFDDIEGKVDKIFTLFEGHGKPIKIPLDAVSDEVKELDIVIDDLDDASQASSQEVVNDLTKIENKTADVTAKFQELINYISKSGTNPGSFFDKIESGAKSIDDELNNILQSLGMLDSSGNINFESIKSGFTNKGGFVSDQYTMIARPDWYLQKIESIKPMLQNAKQMGANIGAIFDIIEDKSKGLIYEIQNTVSGKSVLGHHSGATNQDILNATDSQIQEFINTLQILQKNGLFIDWGGDNILYDKDKGFSVIDLGNKGGKPHTVSSQNTMQENLDRFASEIFKFDHGMGQKFQSLFVNRLYDMAATMGEQVVNPNISSVVKQQKSAQDASGKTAASLKSEASAHEQNAAAINTENAALQAQIELKKKAQSMKWEAFALDESTLDLKNAAGFHTLYDMEKFWKAANYEKEIDWHEITESEAMKIFHDKLPSGLASKWYGGADFSAKDKLENEILADNELRNAALNYLYQIYQKNMPLAHKDNSIKSFTDFLNTEFTVYRGDKSPLIYDDQSKLSFSFDRGTAKNFNGKSIGTAKIKPKDTIGNAGSGFDNEIETFISSYQTSWYQKTGEAFEDFYNQQTKEMQKEIDAGLVNFEKKRVSDILGNDLSKLTHQAGKTSYFKDNILGKFDQGIIPDTLDIIGDGSKYDELATAYNSLSEMQKKLVAYYASLDEISSVLPKQFTTHGKKVVGQDAKLFNAILNDPSGLRQHVANLTGEQLFNFTGQGAENIKQETVAHKANTQAIQQETQAQRELNNSKLSYDDVEQKLTNAALDNENGAYFDLYSIWGSLKDIHTTPADVINDGLYEDATGQLFDVTDLLDKIKNVEQKYGENLGYVKDYLTQVYGNLEKLKVIKELKDIDDKFKIDDDVLLDDDDDYLLDDDFGFDLSSLSGPKYSIQDYANGLLYQSDAAYKAIDDLVVFYQKYEELKNKIHSEPIEFLFGSDKPTSSEVYEVQRVLEEFKAKQQEISNMPLVDTEDDKKKLQELQAEVVGLQNKLKGAKIDGATSYGEYKDTYTLSSLTDAMRLKKAIEGPDIYSISNDLEKEFKAAKDNLLANVSTDFHDMLKNDTSDSFEQYLLLLAKQKKASQSENIVDDNNLESAKQELHVEQEITAEKQKQAVLDDEQNQQISKVKTAQLIDDDTQEASELEYLLAEVNAVKQAVENKTNAFKEEGVVVDQVVQQEVESLNKLKTLLDEIQNTLQVVFATDGQKFGDISFEQDKINGAETSNVLQNIHQTLGQILGVLQGFTGIESDNKNSIKYKEPVVDNVGASDAYDLLASKLSSDIATETTLSAIKSSVDQLANLSQSKESENSDKEFDAEGNLVKLVSTLTASVATLQNVASGIVQHQKSQKINTSDATAKIADPNVYKQISDIAAGSVGNLGSDVQIKGMKALADGVVKVEGAFKNAQNQWEGFTVNVNESNMAVDLAIDKQSAFAKALNDTANVAKEVSNNVQNTSNNINKELSKKVKDSAAAESKKLKGIFNTLDFKVDVTGLSNEQQEIASKYKELSNVLEQYGKNASQVSQEELSNTLQRVAALQQEINAYKEKYNINNGYGGTKNAYGKSATINAQAKFNTLSMRSQPYIDAGSTVVSNALTQYENALKDLVELQHQFKSGQELTPEQLTQFEQLKNECNEYGKALKKIIDDSDRLMANGSNPFELMDDVPLNTFNDRARALENYVKETYGASASINKLNGDATQLTFTIKNGDGTITNMAASLNRARTAIVSTTGETQKATTAFGRFFDDVKSKFRSITTYIISMTGIEEVWQQIRQGVQYVRDIDSALTELKKVTTETNSTYDAFLQKMSKTAGVVGSTVSELTTMASEWARLGYSLEEAGMLAESTAILLNVSEFNDATEASEALISTMQAFGYVAEDSQHVVDILNEVGNNYAVSSDGIATALQDSASALMEGGNSLEQATALVAAANKVVQDPSSVGSALRTISLRLRGTSVEILEEMGEETDGVVESTSKLQEKLKALTGVDILTDTGAYKDTYTILKEIGNVWKDLDSLDQAAALELMAGKNRANTLSAILNNMDDLTGAYESALNAEGSALRENEAYLDSIQGRIDLFTNALQTMWMNFMSSDAIKFVVDLGTAAIKLVDALGVIPTAVGGFTAFKLVSKSIGEDFANMGEEIRKAMNISGADVEQSDILDNVADNINAVTQAQEQKTKATELSSQATQKNTQVTLSNVAAEKMDANADQASATAENMDTAATKKNTAATIANTVATKAAAVAGKLVKGALFGIGISLATAAIGKLMEGIDSLIHAEERAIERADEALNKYRNDQDDLKGQKSTVDELASSYTRLSSGVNTLTNDNIGLTVESYEEYLKVCNQIADMYPELVQGYDAQGNAILNLQGKVDGLTGSYKKAQEEAANTLLTSQNKKDIWTKYEDKAVVGQWVEDGTYYRDLTAQHQKDVLEAVLSMGYDNLKQFVEADKKGNSSMWNILEKQLNANGVSMDTNLMHSAFNQTLNLSSWAEAFDSVDAYKNYVNQKLSEVNQAISDSMSGLREVVSADLIFNQAYQNLDEGAQGMVKAIINNMDLNMVAESGAESADQFIDWFSSNVISKVADNQGMYSGLTEVSNNMAKAMFDKDNAAFEYYHNEFMSKVEDWIDDSSNIVVDPDADIVTQYLQQLAKDMENKSKNYQVRVKIATDIEEERPFKYDLRGFEDDLADVAEELGVQLEDFFDLSSNEASMKDVYTKLGSILDDGDGKLRADEIRDVYQSFLDGDMSSWSEEQQEAMLVLDNILKLYGTDLETLIATLIDLGYVYESLSDIPSFDLASESTNEDIDAFQEAIETIRDAWESLNSKDMTKSEFIDLAQEFPELMNDVDFSDDNWMTQAKTNLESLNATTIDNFIAELNKMKEAMDARGEDTTIVDSFITYAEQLRDFDTIGDVVQANTITGLTEVYEKYKSIMEETNEVLYDGQKVSDGYYESLKEYIDDTESLNACFDENNKQIVTNVGALKELIAAQKEADTKSVKLAKSQAQLQYYELVKQLDMVVEGYDGFTDESKASADALIDQIGVIRNAINQYQLLEDSLLGTTSAFEKFSKAQEQDAQNTYGDQYVEMVQTMYDAMTDTGKLGTPQFWVAAEALVPDEVYDNLDSSYEKIQAIYEYFNSNILPTLGFDEDTFSIGYKAVEDFVKKAQEIGVFSGTDVTSFGLSAEFLYGLEEDEDALQAFADRMGMTVTQVYTMLSEMDKYNADGIGLSMLLQLDQSTTGQITNETNELERLYVERKKLIEQRDEMSAKGQDTSEIEKQLDSNWADIGEAESQIAGLEKKASDAVSDYIDVVEAIANISGNTELTVDDLENQIPPELYVALKLHEVDSVDAALQRLTDYKLQLEEPTVMEFEIRKDQIESEISRIESQDPTIKTKIELDEESGLYKVKDEFNKFGDELTLEGELRTYLDLKNEQVYIGNELSSALTPSEQYLSRIADNTDTMVGKETEPANGQNENQQQSPTNGGENTNIDPYTASGSDVVDNTISLMHAIEKRQKSYRVFPNTFNQQHENLVALHKKVQKLQENVNNGILSPENARAQLSELQTEASKYGVEVPIRFKPEEGQVVAGSLSGEVQEEVKETTELVDDATSEAEKLYEVYASNEEMLATLRSIEDKSYALTQEEALAFDLQIDEGQVLTVQNVIDYLLDKRDELKQSSLFDPKWFDISAVQTYSELQSQATSFNDIISQTDELMGDNTEVTQSYKDSLLALCDTQEEVNELNEYFYTNSDNKIIATNSKAIKKLVAEKKKELATDVKLSKAQSQLEYYDLVRQLNGTLSGVKNLDNATINHVNSILSQIDVVQQSIYKFQLLEDQLLGTTNAFEKYQEAQEIDSANTYGDDYVSMAQTMYDAFYKTGEVGTQANWEAIQALVPPEVYQHLKNEGDQLKAIYDYFNKNILPTLTLEDDQFSLDYDAVENFVEKGMGSVFVRDETEDGKTNLDLVEGMNLEKAAELMGMTETQAYAMFAALDKFNFNGNGQSFLEMLDDSLSGDIMKVTSNIEDLNKEKLALLDGGVTKEEQKRINEINYELSQNEKQLKILGATAYSTWQEYTQTDAVLQALGSVEDKSQLLTEEMAKQLGINFDENSGKTIQQVYDEILAKKLLLEQPTVLTAQLAIENIDAQIKTLEQSLESGNYTNIDPVSIGLEVGQAPTKEDIEAKLAALKEDKAVIATTFNIELTEEEKASIKTQLNEIEQFTINDKEFTVTGNTSLTMLKLLAVKTAVDNIKGKEIEIKTKYTSEGAPPSGGVDVNGTAHIHGTAFKGGSWGAERTETALVGELGPEMVVRGNKWTLVGTNGAEFTDIRKGDIIFNHKQTEDLLSHGYVSGRGKAYAEGTVGGTAYALWSPTSPEKSLSNAAGSAIDNSADKLSKAADAISDSSDEFKEVFDWIEVRLEEINEDISLKSAKLENTVGSTKQNAVIDDMIELNQKLYDNLTAGAAKYNAFAAKLLAKVPEEYRKAAQDGSIAIESFTGEVGEKTLEAIQNYREWVQKGADVTQQAEETLTEIANLARQAIDNIASDYENKSSIPTIKIEQMEAYNSLIETTVGAESEKVYKAIIKANNENIKILEKQRNKMQAELNAQVEAGNIKKYSQLWYDAVNDIAAVDTEIINLTTDTEDYQDTINELHWEHFDNLMSRLEAISDEAENLIDILGSKDLVNKDTAEWTDEGITTLGLYAQQMEVAEMQSKKYKEEIQYLNKNWKKLGYTEQEYVEKLEELKNGQYDAIKAYNDTKDAIVDLTSERVDTIKSGIEKEIESYEKLIEAKKEELDAEKD